MLDINREIICRLVLLAREFHAQEAVVIPEVPDSPSGDWGRQMLASHAGDPTFQEFKSIVLDLEPDQQHQLVALMWLGRGDYVMEEWNDAVEYAAENAGPNTAQYLIAHPLLSDYLEEGLQLHGFSCGEDY